MQSSKSPAPKIVCFGEVLWDIFPDKQTAGGAPFNVAYNLKKMGIDAYMISRIGHDSLGHKLIDKIQSWGIDTSTVQIDEMHQTSTVQAHIDANNEASYEIVNDVAWDYIETKEEDKRLLGFSKAFVFGSLATRNVVTRNTLFELLEYASYKVFDVNLRTPFIDMSRIQDLLRKCNMAKMNLSELHDVSAASGKPYTNTEDQMLFVQEKYHLDGLIVTKGDKGALYLTENSFFKTDAVKVQVADTVGSGDAFLAGFLSGKFLEKNEPDHPLSNAGALGAFITNQYGACPDYSIEDFENFKRENKAAHSHDIASQTNQ